MKSLTAVALAAIALAILVAAIRPFDAPQPTDEPTEVENLHSPSMAAVRALAKQAVADDTLAGRRCLAEAASLFRELNALPPLFDARPEYDVPAGVTADTEAERLCWQVIRYARGCDGRLGDPAGIARLEEELRSRAGLPGGIRLPEPSGLTPVSVLIKEATPRLVTGPAQVESLPQSGPRR